MDGNGRLQAGTRTAIAPAVSRAQVRARAQLGASRCRSPTRRTYAVASRADASRRAPGPARRRAQRRQGARQHAAAASTSQRRTQAGEATVTIGDDRLPRSTASAPARLRRPADPRLHARLAEPRDASTTSDNRTFVGGRSCSASSLLAIACAMLVSRTLQREIARLSRPPPASSPRGDFSAKVPTAGRDEFAALGEEFNKMSRRARAPSGRAHARSAGACSTRCAASARRSPPTSTATRCWSSSCAPPSTASPPTPAARACASTAAATLRRALARGQHARPRGRRCSPSRPTR